MNTHLSPSATLFWRLGALVSLSGALVGVWAYPTANAILALGLALYVALLLRVPAVWLCVLPVLVPILDLTPWSGWFFFEEIDLFVLTTLAVGYWRLSSHPPKLAISSIGMTLLALLGVSYVISLSVGILPLSPFDANAFSNYLSHYNSLRILKGFVWALLLLPLLMRATAQDPNAFSRWFVPGMLLGLCGATLVAWWERWTFIGLTDFATDYRITGMFSGMHVGGAALDGYLALSLPFLLAWIVTRTGWARTLFAAGLFFAASYAVMATFSRGLYLAYGLAILFGLIAVFRSGPPGAGRRREALVAVAALLISGGLLWQAFGFGGFRTLASLIVLFAALGMVVPLLHRGAPWFGALLLAPLAFALSWVLGLALDKGPYIAFALSAVVLVVAADLARAQSGSTRYLGQLLAAMSLLWLGFNVCGSRAIGGVSLRCGMPLWLLACACWRCLFHFVRQKFGRWISAIYCYWVSAWSRWQ